MNEDLNPSNSENISPVKVKKHRNSLKSQSPFKSPKRKADDSTLNAQSRTPFKDISNSKFEENDLQNEKSPLKDADESWTERTVVLTKQTRQNYRKYSKETIEDIISQVVKISLEKGSKEYREPERLKSEETDSDSDCYESAEDNDAESHPTSRTPEETKCERRSPKTDAAPIKCIDAEIKGALDLLKSFEQFGVSTPRTTRTSLEKAKHVSEDPNYNHFNQGRSTFLPTNPKSQTDTQNHLESKNLPSSNDFAFTIPSTPHFENPAVVEEPKSKLSPDSFSEIRSDEQIGENCLPVFDAVTKLESSQSEILNKSDITNNDDSFTKIEVIEQFNKEIINKSEQVINENQHIESEILSKTDSSLIAPNSQSKDISTISAEQRSEDINNDPVPNAEIREKDIDLTRVLNDQHEESNICAPSTPVDPLTQTESNTEKVSIEANAFSNVCNQNDFKKDLNVLDTNLSETKKEVTLNAEIPLNSIDTETPAQLVDNDDIPDAKTCATSSSIINRQEKTTKFTNFVSSTPINSNLHKKSFTKFFSAQHIEALDSNTNNTNRKSISELDKIGSLELSQKFERTNSQGVLSSTLALPTETSFAKDAVSSSILDLDSTIVDKDLGYATVSISCSVDNIEMKSKDNIESISSNTFNRAFAESVNNYSDNNVVGNSTMNNNEKLPDCTRFIQLTPNLQISESKDESNEILENLHTNSFPESSNDIKEMGTCNSKIFDETHKTITEISNNFNFSETPIDKTKDIDRVSDNQSQIVESDKCKSDSCKGDEIEIKFSMGSQTQNIPSQETSSEINGKFNKQETDNCASTHLEYQKTSISEIGPNSSQEDKESSVSVFQPTLTEVDQCPSKELKINDAKLINNDEATILKGQSDNTDVKFDNEKPIFSPPMSLDKSEVKACSTPILSVFQSGNTKTNLADSDNCKINISAAKTVNGSVHIPSDDNTNAEVVSVKVFEFDSPLSHGGQLKRTPKRLATSDDKNEIVAVGTCNNPSGNRVEVKELENLLANATDLVSKIPGITDNSLSKYTSSLTSNEDDKVPETNYQLDNTVKTDDKISSISPNIKPVKPNAENVITKASRGLTLEQKLTDPNFNPFETKSNVTNSPVKSPNGSAPDITYLDRSLRSLDVTVNQQYREVEVRTQSSFQSEREITTVENEEVNFTMVCSPKNTSNDFVDISNKTLFKKNEDLDATLQKSSSVAQTENFNSAPKSFELKQDAIDSINIPSGSMNEFNISSDQCSKQPKESFDTTVSQEGKVKNISKDETKSQNQTSSINIDNIQTNSNNESPNNNRKDANLTLIIETSKSCELIGNTNQEISDDINTTITQNMSSNPQTNITDAENDINPVTSKKHNSEDPFVTKSNVQNSPVKNSPLNSCTFLENQSFNENTFIKNENDTNVPNIQNIELKSPPSLFDVKMDHSCLTIESPVLDDIQPIDIKKVVDLIKKNNTSFEFRVDTNLRDETLTIDNIQDDEDFIPIPSQDLEKVFEKDATFVLTEPVAASNTTTASVAPFRKSISSMEFDAIAQQAIDLTQEITKIADSTITLATKETFSDANTFFINNDEIDNLETFGTDGNPKNINLARNSLFVKFDPLVAANMDANEAVDWRRVSSLMSFSPVKRNDDIPMSTVKQPNRSVNVFSSLRRPCKSAADVEPPNWALNSTLIDFDATQSLHNSTFAQLASVGSKNDAAVQTEKEVVTTEEQNLLIMNYKISFQDELLRKSREFVDLKAKYEKEIEAKDSAIEKLNQDKTSVMYLVTKYKELLQQIVEKKSNIESEMQDQMDQRELDHQMDLAQLHKEISKLQEELKQGQEQQSNYEKCFMDYMQKHNKATEAIAVFQRNEAILREQNRELAATLQAKTDSFAQSFKEFEATVLGVQEELKNEKELHRSNVDRAHVMLRRAEVKILSLNKTIEQKDQENQELSALLDRV